MAEAGGGEGDAVPSALSLFALLQRELSVLRHMSARELPPPPPLPRAPSAAASSSPPPVRALGLPDAVLRRLDLLLVHDGVLDRALEALDAGCVTRLVGRPSGRVAWAITSTSLPRRAPAELAALDLAASGLSEAAGAGLAYTVLLHGPGCCSCADFAARVLLGDVRGVDEGGPPAAVHTVGSLAEAAMGGGARPGAPPPRRFCKHLLAAALADALGPSRYKEGERGDEELARVLTVAFGV